MRALVLALLVLGTASPAAADAWADARAAFREAQKERDWRLRQSGYAPLSDFDRAEAVEEILGALSREPNGAVVLGAIKTLAGYRSPEALAAIGAAAREGRGARRNWALLALVDQPGEAGKDVLLEVVQGKDLPLAAQAAMGLGKKQVREAVPLLVALLQHKEWQVRAAAARGLRDMPGKWPIDPHTLKETKPTPPPWFDANAVLRPLVDALAAGVGRERADVVDALQRISGQDFGYDVPAWRFLVAGAPPDKIKRDPVYPPHVFGIPIYGRRVVVVIDQTTCTDDAHPFQDIARLKEMCRVPGARDVPWQRLRTTKDLIAAHAKRLVDDLPAGASFEVLFAELKIKRLFGKLQAANAGTKAAAVKEIDELDVKNGLDVLEALNVALDAAGTSDAVAWQSGPDEIVMLTCSVPWRAPVTDQAVIGASIGLKARLRMVPIHLVGVGPHPFELMTLVAEQSGGRYLDRSR
jgi:hypothetical protein